MIQNKRLLILFGSIVLALALVAIPFVGALAQDTMPAPLDPQSWQANKDKGWDAFVPNPVIDWMTQLEEDGLANSKAIREGRNPRQMTKGAIILVDFIDKPFITSQPLGSDLFGFTLFERNKPGVYENKITVNPVRNNEDRDTLAQWWCDYLNKKLAINGGSSFDELSRENTYGKWGVELTAFGPYTLNGLELQYGGLGTNDRPPSLRFSGSILNEGTAAALAGADGRPAWNPDEFDFFFVIHAGYDESGVWLPFGMMQWPAITLAQAKRIVPDLYGPKTKLAELEALFTKRPQDVERLATKSSSTTFIRNEAAKIAAMRQAGTLSQYKFEFPQSEWDWAETTGNAAPTRYVAWTAWAARISYWSGASSWPYQNSAITGGSRSLNYSVQGENDGMATFAHEYGHISGIGDNYDNPYTTRVSPRTEPWELMSRGSFAGPGGDQARWTVPGIEGGSVPVHFMAFNKNTSGSYDAGDVLTLTTTQLAAGTPLVAEIVARNIPLNNRVVDGKKPYQWLEDKFDLVSPNFYKALRLDFGSGTFADQAGTTANRKATGFTWNSTTATRMWVEVVQRTGYDSYAPDDGVLIARDGRMIDSHLYDIALIDYVQKDGFGPGIDDYASHTLCSMAQVYDAAFHVGKSFTDTGYYRSIYDPADPNYSNPESRYYAGEGTLSWQKKMIKPGSVVQWEPQDGRPVASGDTVNEWRDPYNKLHFYILDKTYHDGRTLPGESKPQQFLSYTVGVLHEDGQAVNGELKVGLANLEPEIPRKVAVASFDITNTGDATDIIRVTAEGYLQPVLLNDLYALAAGETKTVSIYIELPADIRTRDLKDKAITFSASSESNSGKKDSVTIAMTDFILYNYRVYLAYNEVKPIIGETFSVDLMLWGDINYSQIATEITFDPDLLEFAGYQGLIGWAAAVTNPVRNIVAVRSVPSMNMVAGANCNPDIKIVTLQFKVKDAFTSPSIDTKICFASAVVSPPGGVTGTGVYPTKCLPIKLFRTRALPINAHYYGKWQYHDVGDPIVINEKIGARINLQAIYYTAEHPLPCDKHDNGNCSKTHWWACGEIYIPPTGDIASYANCTTVGCAYPVKSPACTNLSCIKGRILTGTTASGNALRFQWYVADTKTNDPAAATLLDWERGIEYIVDTSVAAGTGTRYYFAELTHTVGSGANAVVKSYYSDPVEVNIAPFGFPADQMLPSERSGYRVDTRSADVNKFLEAITAASGGRIRMDIIGYTLGIPPLPAGVTGAQAAPWRVAMRGTQPQPIYLLVMSEPGKPIPQGKNDVDPNKAIFMVNAGIHAGECAPKESMLLFARDVAHGKYDDLLKDAVILNIPNHNADGNDYLGSGFGDRPDTNGNRQTMGVIRPQYNGPNYTDSNANNGYNVNRDSTKLDAPETRALVKVLNEWDPIVYMDLHEGGTIMRESNTWAHGLHQGSYEPVREYNRLGFFDVAMGEDSYIVKEKNKRSVIYAPGATTSGVHGGTHGSGLTAGSMQSGTAQWRTFQDHPRFNTNYAGLRNRISFLNETYSTDVFVVRIDTQYDLCLSTLKATISEKDTLKKLIAEADAQAIGRETNPNFPGSEFVILESVMMPRDHAKEGIYNLHTYLAGAGAPFQTGINSGKPANPDTIPPSASRIGRYYAGLANYPIMVMDNFTARKSTPLAAYYLLDSDCENAVANLRFHGIQVEVLSSPLTISDSEFQWFDASVRANAEDLAGWFEGRKRARVDPDNTSITDGTGAMIPTWRGEWVNASSAQIFPAGTYMVSTAQPLGMLAAILLEPGSNDGLFNWTYDEGVFVQNPLAVNHFDNRLDAKVGMVRANYPSVVTKGVQGTYCFPIFKVGKFDVFDKPITATGIDSACNLGIMQQGVWKYALAPANVGVPNEFMVANNGIAYQVHLTKPGFHPIERPGLTEDSLIYAGNTIHFGSPYFYKIKVAAGVSEVKITSNGTIVENGAAGQAIDMLCDFLGTIRTAVLNLRYANVNHQVEFLLDGTDPFEIIKSGIIAIPMAKVESIDVVTNRLTVTITELHPDGAKHEVSATFTINNNDKGTYIVGPCPDCQRIYSVYVDTKGNDQIRECRIVQYDPIDDDDIDDDDGDIK